MNLIHSSLNPRFGEGLSLFEQPADGRCELCKGQPRKLHPDYNCSSQERRRSLSRCHRGWVCHSCRTLLEWADDVGPQKLFDYLKRLVALGDKVPEYPSDGCCDLCRSPPGTRGFNLDHDHNEQNRWGLSVIDSSRGYVCTRCNTSMLPRVDKIGVVRLYEYLQRGWFGTSLTII
jgi:hypothetical protein